MNKTIGVVAALLFVATVYAANWAFVHYGVVSVGFGLSAPAAVYFVGLAFTLRDIVHRNLGRYVVIGCILVGALLSYFVEANVMLPGAIVSLAVASGISFLASEFADLFVYEPIRARGWLPAVVASNIVGILVDSVLFLWLINAMGFFWGQVVGKAWMTVAAVIVLLAVRAISRRPEAVPA